MKKTAAIPFVIFFVFYFSGATEVRISKIKSPVVFITESGQCIRLAGLTSVNPQSDDERERNLAKQIIRFAEANLTAVPLEAEFLPADSDSCRAVHLFRLYPLEKKNINALYLQKGYARYDSSGASAYDSLYSAAERQARKFGNGLWNLNRYKPVYVDRYHRLRLHAGGVTDTDAKHIFPNFWLNYRWSDMLPVLKSDQYLLSLSAEGGTTFLFFYPYVLGGAEMRFKNVYLHLSAGWLWPVFFPTFSDDESGPPYPLTRMAIGVQIKPLSDYRYMELECSLNRLRDADELIILMSVVFPVF